jgi:hypothetical protein
MFKQLHEVIDYRKKLSQELPEAERKYRQAMAMTIVKLHAGEIADYGKVAWSVCYNIAKGLNGDLMEIRDEKKYMLESSQEKIYALKLHINVIEGDIESFRKGGV